MSQIRPMKVFLPAMFLLLLGLGNIGVGVYKMNQYERVIIELSELSDDETAAILLKATPLKRIQLTREKEERLIELQKKARARRDFYQFFVAGGSLFLFLSGILIFFALVLKLNQRSVDRSHLAA